MKKIIAFIMSVITCVGAFSVLGVFADGNEKSVSLPEIVYWEDFTEAQQTGKINTSGSWIVAGESNGFFLCATAGSTTYDFSEGTLKYLTKKSGDYFDVRLRNGGPVEKDLAQDFILSFKVKPYTDSFTADYSFSSNEEKSVTVNSFKIRKGKFYVGDTPASTAATVPANTWSLIELAFHYNESRQADNAMYTGGAIDSYTVMLNGEALYTATLTDYIQNIDFFRMFRWTGDNVLFEVDDIRIALGNTSLKVFDENGGVKKETYEKNISWITDKTSVTDYAYSFCVVGDTQMVCRYFPDNMKNIYDWILANKDSKKIAHVFGLGDITDANTDEEWAVAKAQIDRLNGKVSHTLVRGNHDGAAKFNSNFSNSAYTGQLDGFYQNGKIENCYKKLDVGTEKYLMLTLDNGPVDAVLEWADGIIKANSDRKVIISTHAYLSQDGDTLKGGVDADTPSKNGEQFNDGDDIWNELIYENKNVFMVLCGHIDADRVIQTKAVGKHGNEVIQILSDSQSVDQSVGPTGMVTMLYFSEDGKKITVETYSTVRNAFFMEENQFEIDVVKYELGGNGGNDSGNGGNGSENTGTGKDGKDGLTPYIGENGNWWIGDTDTGVRAAAEDGKDGKDGADGAAGKDATAASGGCGGSVGAGIALMCAMSVGACVFTRKKRRYF